MPQILRITSEQQKAMGRKAVKSFGVHGGTIGRSMENDWVLSDPNRYISGHHATIDNQGGIYYLIDTSTNGVYLNGSDHPVGDKAPQRLYDGDKLRMGSFQMQVRIRESGDISSSDFAETDPALENSAAFEEFAAQTAVFDRTNTQVTVPWTGQPGDSQEVMELRDTPGQAVNEEGTGERQGDWSMIRIPETGEIEAIDSAPDESIAEMISTEELSGRVPILELEVDMESKPPSTPSRPPPRVAMPKPATAAPAAKPAPRPRPELKTQAMDKAATRAAIRKKPAPGAPQTTDAQAALEYVLRGAGLSPDGLRSAEPAEVLETAGEVLRALVTGIVDVLQSRSNLKNKFRLAQTAIRPAANNPLKFSVGVDEAVLALLERKSPEYLAPKNAVEESFRDIKRHQQATDYAMRIAFEEFLERFDPAELQERFDRGLKRGPLMGMANKFQYWELYKELYEVMTARSDSSFPHLFGEEFARAYEERLDALEREAKKND